MTMAAESKEVRGLITRAAEEAAAIGNDYIGAVHLLLAVIADPTGPAVRLLESLDVQPAMLRERSMAQIRRGERIHRDVTDLTSRARASLKHADAEAERHEVQSTRGVDLLVGLIAQEDSLASRVMREAGLTYDALHHAVYRSAKF